MEEILRGGFGELGIPADDRAISRFRRYYDYLDERGRVMNLTAIRGEADTARLHFLDCCALLNAADFRGRRVIDVGSGAGFPGLPLRIAEESIALTLLDSQGKRVDFLRETCALLGLPDVRCLLARAEEAPPELREAFDIAVSRAVARLNILCEVCMPFVRPDGVFIAMKGRECPEELEEARGAVRVLGGEVARVCDYTIPGTDIVRTAVVIRKISRTPDKYPRRWAKICKQPL